MSVQTVDLLDDEQLREAHGITIADANAHRELDLPVDDTLVRSLADEPARHHAAYRLVSWRGACPASG